MPEGLGSQAFPYGQQSAILPVVLVPRQSSPVKRRECRYGRVSAGERYADSLFDGERATWRLWARVADSRG